MVVIDNLRSTTERGRDTRQNQTGEDRHTDTHNCKVLDERACASPLLCSQLSAAKQRQISLLCVCTFGAIQGAHTHSSDIRISTVGLQLFRSRAPLTTERLKRCRANQCLGVLRLRFVQARALLMNASTSFADLFALPVAVAAEGPRPT